MASNSNWMKTWEITPVLSRLFFSSPSVPPESCYLGGCTVETKRHNLIFIKMKCAYGCFCQHYLSDLHTATETAGFLNTQGWQNAAVSTIGLACVAAYLPTVVGTMWQIFPCGLNGCTNEFLFRVTTTGSINPLEIGEFFFFSKKGVSLLHYYF